MIKHIRLVSDIIFFFFILQDISGQEPISILDNLSEKFQTYCKKFPWQEIFVQTDREEYIAGEEIWFKIYLFDRQNNNIDTQSSIAYLEVLNSENRPIVQKRIKLEYGLGPGEVTLPDTLSSGSYVIRAYTNWMKNFLPSNCFIKKITICNSVINKRFNGISRKLSIPEELNATKILNASRGTGFGIQINNSDPDTLKLKIETDMNFRSINGKECYMLIQTHGRINFKGGLNLPENAIWENVIKKNFLPGINQIAIFNQKGKLIAERYIYISSHESALVSVTSDVNFKRREKIILEIELNKNLISYSDSAVFSISVAESTGVVSLDIADYLILGSEFGVVHDDMRNSDLDDMPEESLDKLLSTLKSNWIDWNKILSDIYPVLKYDREIDYHYLNGRLLGSNTLASGEKNFLFLSIPGKKATFQYAKTDSDGNFCLRIPVTNELKDLIIQPEFEGKDISIKTDSPYSEVYPETVSAPETLGINMVKLLSRQGVNYQVKKIYESDQPAEKNDKPVFATGTERFYGKPDIQLVLDDYIKLPVMQEVFFELMPGVFLKKKKSGYEISIADPVERKIFEKPPVLFVDGVVIHDPAIIAGIDPEIVEEIDAIRERYMIGDYLFYGLVNVITKAGDFRCVSLPDYAVRFSYNAIDPVPSFSAPGYTGFETKWNRMPDLRNTLFWDPAIGTDREGKARIEFWSSDYLTDYVINIHGVTKNGKLISYKKLISIE